MELSDAQYDEMVLLASGRWDPRRGRGRLYSQLIGPVVISLFGVILVSSCCCFSTPYFDELFVLFVSIVVLPTIWFAWRSRQTRASARSSDYSLCPWCRYVLEGLEDRGNCPECGTQYELELCRVLYKLAFASAQPARKEKEQIEINAWKQAILLRDGMIQAEHSD